MSNLPVNGLPTKIMLGAVGGLVGTGAMRLYWRTATALTGEDPRGMTHEGAPHALDEMDVAGRHREEGESSTAAVGREAYETVAGEAPSEETKTELSYAVHWGYGTAMGGLYGALQDGQEGFDASGGLAFGTALWLLGDELMVPLLGLSKGATAYPPAQHAHRLGAHLAYGLAAAATVQAGRALLSTRARPHNHNGERPSRSWGTLAWKAAKAYLQARAGKKAVEMALEALRR